MATPARIHSFISSINPHDMCHLSGATTIGTPIHRPLGLRHEFVQTDRQTCNNIIRQINRTTFDLEQHSIHDEAHIFTITLCTIYRNPSPVVWVCQRAIHASCARYCIYIIRYIYSYWLVCWCEALITKKNQQNQNDRIRLIAETGFFQYFLMLIWSTTQTHTHRIRSI